MISLEQYLHDLFREGRQYLYNLFRAVPGTYMISLERGEPWPAGPRLRLLLSCARLSAAQK